MPTPVLMPQMGESVAEGTIVRWIKKVGDAVDRDEPLFEISTDKVDAEIPAPAAGVLTEIKVREGETVAVNSIVGTIGGAGEAARDEPGREEPVPGPPTLDAADVSAQPVKPSGTTRKSNGRTAASTPVAEEMPRQRSSPLVRRIAREHNIDVSRIHGSGLGGRVTKHDILGHIETGTRDSGPGTRDSGLGIRSSGRTSGPP
jgi:pyruvate dehydrogenase E2 component (dihydrolipoamide acetyltransferase)